MTQLAFEAALDKDYVDIAYEFIRESEIHLTWNMVRKMLANQSQVYLVRQCIKNMTKFETGDIGASKKIVFHGRAA